MLNENRVKITILFLLGFIISEALLILHIIFLIIIEMRHLKYAKSFHIHSSLKRYY